jgi:hypothetical protein
MDGIILASDGVLHVHAKSDSQLEFSRDGNVLGSCGNADSDGHDHGRRLIVEKWNDCYDGDSATRSFSIGIAIGSGLFQRKFSNDHEAVAKWINSIVAEANVIYRPQLNIALSVGEVVIQQSSQGAPAWDDPNCELGLSSQLSNFRQWQQPSKRGLWHLFDDCFGVSGSSIGLATMLVGDPAGTLCMMDPVPGWNEFWNTAVSWYSFNTWKTFAHEVGHNFGGHHSFEDGQGKTGGIMDYGDGKLDGEYQFNTKYRKTEICKSIQKVIGTCSAFSIVDDGTTITTTRGTGTIITTTKGTGTTSTTTVASATTTVACGSLCQDKLGVTSTITFNGVKYTDCASLISATNDFTPGLWCTRFEAQFKVCAKSCGTCGAPSQCTSTTTASQPVTSTVTTTEIVGPVTTTTAVATTATTTGELTGIRSGDTVFLKTLSGVGKHIDVEGTVVRARWESQGDWQALVIEKEGGGSVSSGDIVYLKAHTGAHIDILDESVQARWTDKGSWQALTIEKRTGHGAVLPGDDVCFKAHTGKRLDVQDDIIRARWSECGDWQTMRIDKEVDGAVFSGASIHLIAHTGTLVDVEDAAVQARWAERGDWQTFEIESYGGRAIYSGDAVFLKAHTGKFVDVQDLAVQARWSDRGTWQKLFIQKKGGSGVIMPGDTIFLRAHTQKILDIDGAAVQARWSDRGDWQSLVIEKALSRRLRQASEDTLGLATLLGVSAGVLGVFAMLLISVSVLRLMRRRRWEKLTDAACLCKVQPVHLKEKSDVDVAGQ